MMSLSGDMINCTAIGRQKERMMLPSGGNMNDAIVVGGLLLGGFVGEVLLGMEW